MAACVISIVLGEGILSSWRGQPADVVLHLRKTSAPDELAACFVKRDGSDGCRVGFTPWEHAVGARGSLLDGKLVRVFEVFTPEHPNSHCRALYHRNRGYALAEIVVSED